MRTSLNHRRDLNEPVLQIRTTRLNFDQHS